MSTTRRNYLLAEAIVSHPAFNEAAKKLLNIPQESTVDDIKKIIRKYTDLNEITANRRASTVIKWINTWFNKIPNNFDLMSAKFERSY